MKKLLLLLFSLTLSFNSYGEWAKLVTIDNTSLYINLETLKERDGYVYYWLMDSMNDKSSQGLLQGDCDIKRFRILEEIDYYQPMAQGEGLNQTVDDSWEYIPPNDTYSGFLDMACLLAPLSLDEKEKIVKEFLRGFETAEQETKEAKEAEAEIQYRQLLAEEVQDEQELANLLIAEDQLNMLQNAYINNIAARVKSFWRYQSAEDDWTAEVYVIQDRNGNVKAVDVRSSNVGNSPLAKSFMDSIERAVFKASPFPGAPDEAVFDREIYMLFSVK